MNAIQASPLSLVAAVTLAACTASPPSQEGPFCGEPIAAGQVLVLDASALGDDADAVAEFVGREAGPYRLVTEQPIGIYSSGRSQTVGDVRFVRSPVENAAARGCDLMLVLGEDETTERAGGLAYAGHPEDYVIVHLGMRENGQD